MTTRIYLVALCFVALAYGRKTLERPTYTLDTTLDFDVFAYSPPADKSTNQLSWKHLTGNYSSTGRPYSAYFAVFHPSYFAFYPSSPFGCKSLVKPSEASYQPWSDCEYATNGGFFDTNPDNLAKDNGTLCENNLVSSDFSGKLLYSQLPDGGVKRANFGISAGTSEIITGFIDAETISSSYQFTQLLTGFGWVVRGGVSNVALTQDLKPTDGFVTEKAPRTAVGVMPSGLMCLLEIDGEEDIYAGPDLFEQAELLVSLGVLSAVNIDGGGSSVSVSKGQVIDVPTCKDTPEVCERATASFACVHKAQS